MGHSSKNVATKNKKVGKPETRCTKDWQKTKKGQQKSESGTRNVKKKL